MSTPEPLDEWQARMEHEQAGRLPEPQGRDRLRYALATGIGIGVWAVVAQYSIGIRGAGLVIWFFAAMALGFCVRYVANPRPRRLPWE